jgi:hypothetical protein
LVRTRYGDGIWFGDGKKGGTGCIAENVTDLFRRIGKRNVRFVVPVRRIGIGSGLVWQPLLDWHENDI